MTTVFSCSRWCPEISRRWCTWSAVQQRGLTTRRGCRRGRSPRAAIPSAAARTYVSWTRFDEYSFANYLRNEVNGGVAQINPGDYPNSDYWLRMDRVRQYFHVLSKAPKPDAWKLETFPGAGQRDQSDARTDLAGLPLQVGIIHATFNGQLGVQFSNFSITRIEHGFVRRAPSPATVPDVGAPTAGGLNVSWTPAGRQQRQPGGGVDRARTPW